MKIRRITIRDFGKLHNRSIDLDPGINVLYGENESGKSTVHTFIKSMFYGISRGRGRAANKDVYSVYCPWEHPATFGGILWFENGGKNFRLTRNFYKENQTDELLCEDDGEILDIENGDLEMILGGMSEAVYENTVSVAQLKSGTGAALVHEVQNYMASFQGTGDSSLDLDRASQMLKMSRKGYQVQAEKRRRQLGVEKEKIAANLEYLRKETLDLQEKKRQIESQAEAFATDRGDRSVRALENHIRKREHSRKVSLIVMAICFLAAIAAGIIFTCMDMPFSTDMQGPILPTWPAIVAAVIAVVDGIAMAVRWKQKDEIEKYRKLLKKRIARQEKLAWSRETIEETEQEKRTAISNLSAEYQETEEQEAIPSSDDIEVQAINLAMETIEKLSAQIHSQVGGKLKERTSQILSEITGGKYREVLLDSELHISINTGERIVRMENLSRGTVEQIYFSLRMAAGELLGGGEDFPLFLDEIFGMYDQERLGGVLQWLVSQKRQAIITSCQTREIDILEEMGIPYHRIDF